jgi:hypothetical protein
MRGSLLFSIRFVETAGGTASRAGSLVSCPAFAKMWVKLRAALV